MVEIDDGVAVTALRALTIDDRSDLDSQKVDEAITELENTLREAKQ